MQRLEVSGAVRPIYGSLGVKRLNKLIPEYFQFQYTLLGNFSGGKEKK